MSAATAEILPSVIPTSNAPWRPSVGSITVPPLIIRSYVAIAKFPPNFPFAYGRPQAEWFGKVSVVSAHVSVKPANGKRGSGESAAGQGNGPENHTDFNGSVRQKCRPFRRRCRLDTVGCFSPTQTAFPGRGSGQGRKMRPSVGAWGSGPAIRRHPSQQGARQARLL